MPLQKVIAGKMLPTFSLMIPIRPSD